MRCLNFAAKALDKIYTARALVLLCRMAVGPFIYAPSGDNTEDDEVGAPLRL